MDGTLDDGRKAEVRWVDLSAWPGPGSPERLLGAAEAGEARRFRFSRHRFLFSARRVAARAIVARYLGVDPRRVRFDRPAGRKPTVVVDGCRVGLAFSVSGSGTIAAVALAREGRLGIDIERRGLVPERVAIARELFGDTHARAIGSAPEPESSATFLRLWTRKEAIGKALGRGLVSGPAAALEDSFPCRRLDRADVLGCLASDEPIEEIRQATFRWCAAGLESAWR